MKGIVVLGAERDGEEVVSPLVRGGPEQQGGQRKKKKKNGTLGRREVPWVAKLRRRNAQDRGGRACCAKV